MCVQISHGEIDDFPEQVLPHPADDALAEMRAAEVLEQLADSVAEIDDQHQGDGGSKTS